MLADTCTESLTVFRALVRPHQPPGQKPRRREWPGRYYNTVLYCNYVNCVCSNKKEKREEVHHSRNK